jgi:hypothetical protein
MGKKEWRCRTKSKGKTSLHRIKDFQPQPGDEVHI